jgi:hypothetical protein
MLLYIPKKSLKFHCLFFLGILHSGNIVGQTKNSELDVGKERLEEWCMWYNYRLFMWLMFRDQENEWDLWENGA